MKILTFCWPGLVALMAMAVAGSAQAGSITIADWTFETSQPATAGPFSPEVGAGSALGYHAGASTFSSLVVNASPHSFASTDWTVGDYYQFEVATTGLQGIHISFDKASVTGGPGLFQLQYSTDGNNFTNFGSPYTVLAASAAAGTEAWSSTIYYSEFHSSIDLSSVTALNNAATVYFRLEDSSTTEAFGGGSVNPSPRIASTT